MFDMYTRNEERRGIDRRFSTRIVSRVEIKNGGGGGGERKDRVIPSPPKYREKSVQRIPLSLLINLVNVFASGFLAFLYYMHVCINCKHNNERYSITYSLERDES